MSLTRLCLIAATVPAFAAAGLVDSLWSTHYIGTTHTQFNSAADIHVDPATGHVYVCGSGEREYGNQTDMLLVKFSENGDTLWSRVIGGNTWSQEDMAHAMVADSAGNIFVAGLTGNVSPRGLDATWAKYAPDGTLLWIKKSLWRDDDGALDIVLGRSRDLYLCGVRTDTLFGLSAFMVMRVDPDSGAIVWTRSFILDTLADSRRNRPRRDLHPDFFDDFDYWDNCATALALTPAGNLAVTGFGLSYDFDREWWTMTITPSGDTLWATTHHHPNTIDHDDDVAFDLAVARTGEIYVAGFDFFQTPVSEQGYNFAVAKYNATGQEVAHRSMNVSAENGDDYAFSLTLDDSTPQNVYVTGALAYPSPVDEQATTFKLSADLQNRWGALGASFGADGDDRGFKVLLRQNRIYVAGRRNLDMSLICYTTANPGLGQSKDTLWTFTSSGVPGLEDLGSAVAVHDSDHIYFAGHHLRYGTQYWTSLVLNRLAYGGRDLLVARIATPRDTVAHLDTIAPEVVVVNQGNMPGRFTAILFIGSNYADTVQTELAPDESLVVRFRDWVAHPVGRFAVRCSVGATSDTNYRNNVLEDSVVVTSRDVACARIVNPVGTLDSGTTITPRAWVRSYSGSPERFPVRMVIAPDYADTQAVNLAPLDSMLVDFAPWTARTVGRWAVTCSTMLDNDADPSNDRVVDSVHVRQAEVRDVGAVRIVTPAETTRFEAIVVPKAVFRNFGNVAASFSVTMTIEPGYRDLQHVNELQPGESTSVDFTPWSAAPPGPLLIAASCELPGDVNPDNDTVRGRIFVRVRDAAVMTILAPRGAIDSGAVVTPTSTVANHGNATERIPVWFLIHRLSSDLSCSSPVFTNHSSVLTPQSSLTNPRPSLLTLPPSLLPNTDNDQVYEDSTAVVLAPGESLTATFRPWTAVPTGSYRAESYTALAEDINRRNDTASSPFTVVRRLRDVGVVSILAPPDTIDTGTVTLPLAVVQNLGSNPETFRVRFMIGAFYQDEQNVVLNPGHRDTVEFMPWIAGPVGSHTARCSTILIGDTNPANDTLSRLIVVLPPQGTAEPSTEKVVPADFVLDRGQPNPFADRVSVRFGLPVAAAVSVRVYSASGILVRNLAYRTCQPGYYRAIWDGRDNNGEPTPAGTYFCRVESGEHRQSTPLVKTR